MTVLYRGIGIWLSGLKAINRQGGFDGLSGNACFGVGRYRGLDLHSTFA